MTVRAFWTATSQLNNVASPVRKVPRTIGAAPSSLGLLTTVMNAFIDTPTGSRIPARVMHV